MTRRLPILDEEWVSQPGPTAGQEAGFGSLSTAQGLLPLEAMDVRARIDGLLAQVTVEQTFVNLADEPLEATYIFPLPDRAAVTGFRMEVAGRVIEGRIDERGKARAAYDTAIETGHRAAIAEEERPGVFTIRVGNLMPRDRAKVRLTLAGPLPYVDGEVTFRFPLVVAPRYVPGTTLPGPPVGDGVASDTDAAPDASRVSPPVLLPGFKNPVRLALSVDLYGPAADPVVAGVRVSLHAAAVETETGVCRVTLLTESGSPLDRDFILRYRLGGETVRTALSFHPDADAGLGDSGQGTFALTLIPPTSRAGAISRPRDVAFVLDRSGSMQGWKIVAARRALARMIDTLGPSDQFAVLAFSSHIEMPPDLGNGLIDATDRHRFRAVEFLSGVESRGGTEMAEPLSLAAGLLARADDRKSDRVLVLITDGQVANEPQILAMLKPLVGETRVFALGIDQAVNEGFLNQLAGIGGAGGACELIESEDRLDEVMESVHRRIATPVLTDVSLEPSGWEVQPETLVPERAQAVFPNAPVLMLGRYSGVPGGLTLRATEPNGESWSESVEPTVRENPAIAAAWARGQVRKLEDHYATSRGDLSDLEKAIVSTSLIFGVLSRFTAFVAIDVSERVNPDGTVHRVTQPVAIPNGWAGMPEQGMVHNDEFAMFSLGMASRFELLPPPSPARGVSPPQKQGRGSGPVPDDTGVFSIQAMNVPSLGQPLQDPMAGFEQVREVGLGGMGVIYRAFDPKLRREVSLKIITKGSGASVSLFKELAARGPLSHPSIASVLEVVPIGGGLMIVSEYVEGQTLPDRLKAGPPLSVEEASLLAYRLATALEYAHSKGLLHSDLSAGNVTIAAGGTAHLIDEFAAPDPKSPGEVIGVSGDVPLERFEGSARLAKLENIYSLGVILYQALTGRLPFDLSMMERLKPTMRGEPAAPSRINPTIPQALDAVCLKAMAPQPADRYATAGEFAAALQPFLAAGALPAGPKKSGGRRKGFWK